MCIGGPQHERSDQWDITYLKLTYADQKIEIGDSNHAYLFDAHTRQWISQGINFDFSVVKIVAGCPLKTMPAAQLIDYKSALNREVDIEDVRSIYAAMTHT